MPFYDRATSSHPAKALAIMGLGFFGLSCRRHDPPTPNDPASGPASVLLITIDTTRADHLGCYGYDLGRTPNLDRLSHQGIVYERCFSPCPLTLPAHASMMTGLYPFEHGLRDNGRFKLDDSAIPLAEILRDQKYQTASIVGAFVLDKRFGLSQGFQHYNDEMPNRRAAGQFSFNERRADHVTAKALAWIKTTTTEPFFMWVHYFDPHADYIREDELKETAQLHPYDAEIAFVDHHLGRLLNQMQEMERLENTLVVVTSDHGEGLDDHGELTHGYFAYNSTLHVPLIVRFPADRFAGTRISDAVSLVDIYPSILEWLAIKGPGDVSGHVLPTSSSSPGGNHLDDRAIYFENYAISYNYGLHALRGIVQWPYKWIDAPKPERYNLGVDFQETRNLFNAADPVSKALRSECLELLHSSTRANHQHGDRSLELDQATATRLEALGYAADPIPASLDEFPAGPDPKDTLDAHRALLRAKSLINADRATDAAQELIPIVADRSYVNPHALLLLANLVVHADATEKVIPVLLPYLEMDLPESVAFAVSAKLGIALGRIGKYDLSVNAYEKASALKPEDPQVRIGLENARKFQRLESEKTPAIAR